LAHASLLIEVATEMANNDTAGCVGCGVVILVGWIALANVDKVKELLTDTAPELFLATAATVVWLIVRRRQNIICKVTGSLLGPVAVGLALLTLLLIVLNAGRLTASYEMVASAEEFLIALRLAISDAASVSLPALIGTIGALIALSAVVPNLRGVTTFVNVKKRVGQLGAVLMVITSFTLFAYVPGARALDEHYGEMMYRFDVSVRKENGAIAHAAAAKTVSRELGAASSETRRRIRVALIRFRAVDDDHGGALPANAAILHARLPPVAPPTPRPRPTPTTGRAYDVVKKKTDDAEARAASAERVASEAEEGVKEIIGQIVGNAVPELEGYAGKFVSKMIDELGERFYAPFVERIMSHRSEADTEAETGEIIEEARRSTGNRRLIDINSLVHVASRLDKERIARLAAEKETSIAFR
jgi:hypothetical protein